MSLYLITFILILSLRLLWQYISVLPWDNTIAHIADSLVIISLAFFLVSIIKKYIKSKKLRKLIINLTFFITILIIFFVFRDQLFAVGISLGILAAILTFIFQTTIISIVGWVYLISGKIYKKGDRIRVGSIKGDVVHISPLRTTVLEVGGEYITSDITSGKIYTFPNSLLLSKPVSNYSQDLSYIWIDIPFHLTYETNFDFLFEKTEEIIISNLKYLKDFKKEYKKLTNKFDVKTKNNSPYYFNVTPYRSWIEFRVTFPVKPKEQSGVRTKITLAVLDLINKNSRKIGFPKGRAR